MPGSDGKTDPEPRESMQGATGCCNIRRGWFIASDGPPIFREGKLLERNMSLSIANADTETPSTKSYPSNRSSRFFPEF